MLSPEKLYETIGMMMKTRGIENNPVKVEDVLNDPRAFIGFFDGFYDAAAQILLECKLDMAGKAPSGVKAAYNRLLKGMKNDPRSENLYGYITDEQENLWYLTNTHYMVALNEVPAGVLPVKDNEGMLRTMRDLTARGKTNAWNTPKISLPELADLKAAIAADKVHNKGLKYKKIIPFDWKEGNRLVNAQYFLDIIIILGGFEEVTVRTDPDKDNGDIYFESETGFGYLLPIKKARKED